MPAIWARSDLVRVGCVALALVSASAVAQPRGVALRIAAASDLRFALEEISAAFRRTAPAVDLVVTYGSSGNFHAQIVQGAPYALFLSADRSYADDLVRRGRAEATTVFTYAIGRLVLWVPASSPLDVTRGLPVLLDSRIRHVAIANPAHAPYGRAAEDAMKRAGVFSQVQPKLVMGDNVTQAAQFVESGAADIGIIARSLAVAPAMRVRGRSWEIPLSMHAPIEQAGVVLARDNRDNRLPAALQLRAFIVGEQGRAILARYGFVLPPAPR